MCAYMQFAFVCAAFLRAARFSADRRVENRHFSVQ